MKTTRIAHAAALLIATSNLLPADPLGTAFSYQGRLQDGANPANGDYDLQFVLFDSPSGGTALATNLMAGTVVSSGLLNAILDFGPAFDGTARWLELGLRPSGSTNGFLLLSPRQRLTPSPTAIYAQTAGQAASANQVAAGAVTAAAIVDGAITSSKVAAGAIVSSNVSPNTFNTTFWRATGNLGTTAGIHFLGTADNQPLELRVNGTRALRLEPTASGGPNVIGGAADNLVEGGTGSGTVAGGSGNHIHTDSTASSIGGGTQNTVGRTANSSTIGGGLNNTISSNAWYTVIAGGANNFVGVDAYESVVLGSHNTISSNSWHSLVAGGVNNFIDAGSPESVVLGSHSTISSNAWHCLVAGGVDNLIDAESHEAVLLGSQSSISSNSWHAVIAGGVNNHIGPGSPGAVLVGRENKVGAGSWDCAITGGRQNTVGLGANSSTISGGYGNVIGDGAWHTVVAGGVNNRVGAAAHESVVLGNDHTVGDDSWHTLIAGGVNNAVGGSSHESVVLGNHNAIGDNSWHALVVGGVGNLIHDSSPDSVIGGGEQNSIGPEASHAVVLGGRNNRASADYAFAAGNSASAAHSGAFVWADSTGTGATSIGQNSVTFRASGGYRLFSSTASVGVQLAAGSGSWSTMSDRDTKENFAPVNAQTVLSKVAALPLTTWNYKTQGPTVRHFGPMAQDFAAAFGLGEDDRTISTVDAQGVALAAIQGLNAKFEAESARLREENAELKARLETLERLLAPRTTK